MCNANVLALVTLTASKVGYELEFFRVAIPISYSEQSLNGQLIVYVEDMHMTNVLMKT